MVPKIRLGELLIREGRLTDDQLQQALGRQKQTGRRLGAVLQDLGFVTDDVIARLLASQLKFPYFEPLLESVDVDIARRLSELQVRKLRALPVGVVGTHVRVAVVDPTDWQSMDELPRLLRGEIDFEVIPESGLQGLIDRIYTSDENIQGLAKKLSEVRAQDGQIIAIGGLMRQASVQSDSGMPGFEGSMWHKLLGGQRNSLSEKRELVILLKPTIVDPGRGEGDGRGDALQRLLDWTEKQPRRKPVAAMPAAAALAAVPAPAPITTAVASAH